MAVRNSAGPGVAKAKARAKAVRELDLIGAKLGSWRRPAEVLTTVRSVPTIFPAVDAAMGCNGLPLERYVLVHGPSGKGKSQLVLGFGRSFLEAGHVFGLIEPEATAPVEWLEALGVDPKNPRFVASRPATYEEAVDQTRELFLGTKAMREGKRSLIPRETRALVVLDAITKLAPKSLVERMLKDGAEAAGVDGMSGSGGRYIAALNAAWTRELTGLLYQTGSTFVAVARERVNQKGGYGPSWEVTGGQSLIFEASIRLRVSYKKPVKVGATVVGMKHMVDVLKLKVADDTVERVEAFFHTSNGEGFAPAGFDRPRDVWELAKETGAVRRFKRKGALGYETFEGERLPDGDEANVERLRQYTEEMRVLEDEGRRRGAESMKKGKDDGERSEEDS